MIVKNTKLARAALARSPSFAMSLGAKELFHTNFLGFLLESDHPALTNVRHALRKAIGFKALPGEHSHCFVWREKKHLDLILVPVAKAGGPVRNRALVIEAKLKSVPTRSQLESYYTKTLALLRLDHDSNHPGFPICLSTKKASTCVKPKLLLLSPSATKVHRQWNAVSWAQVQRKLKLAVQQIKGNHGFKYILNDYVVALEALLEVIEKTRTFAKHCVSTNMTYDDYESELTHAELRQLRLHDLVGKLANDEWARSLQKKLRGHQAALSVSVIFTNSQPGLNLEIDAPNDFKIGIQIQGGQFRHYISHAQIYPELESHINRNNLLKLWFIRNVNQYSLSGLVKKPTSARTNLRCFNRNKFLYSAVDLRTWKMQDVNKAILTSTKLAIDLAHNQTLW